MDSEELLWELSGLELPDPAEEDRELPDRVGAGLKLPDPSEAGSSGAGRGLPESILQAYRSGRMADHESVRVEAVLVVSRTERRRLEALAGIRILAPASVRRRLFGDIAAVGAVEGATAATFATAPTAGSATVATTANGATAANGSNTAVVANTATAAGAQGPRPATVERGAPATLRNSTRAHGRDIPSRNLPWRALAAASIAVLGLLFLWQAGVRGFLPGTNREVAVSFLPEYRIEITGTAWTRSADGGGPERSADGGSPDGSADGGRPDGSARGGSDTDRPIGSGPSPSSGLSSGDGSGTLPETVVAISLLPETAPSIPVAFGVYRQVDDGIQRISEQEMLTSETNRGAASLRLLAGTLVGETPGTRSFYIVVSEPGRLRNELPITGTSSVTAALREASGGRVYERTITIIARKSGTKTP